MYKNTLIDIDEIIRLLIDKNNESSEEMNTIMLFFITDREIDYLKFMILIEMAYKKERKL
jgi:hypothetical protein